MTTIAPWYFANVVEPTYLEFQEEPTNIRRAILACMVAFHTLDAIAEDTGADLEELQERHLRLCPSLRVVEAVCLIGKHARVRKKAYKGLMPENLDEGPGAAFSDGTYYSDGTSHSDAAPVVVLAWPAPADVAHALAAATSYLRNLAAK